MNLLQKILQKEIDQVVTDIMTISKASHEILTNIRVTRTLNSLFTQDRCPVTYHIEERSVKFYGDRKADIQKAKGFISNNVVERMIFVRDASKYYLGSLQWDEFCKGLTDKSPGNIAIDVTPSG